MKKKFQKFRTPAIALLFTGVLTAAGCGGGSGTGSNSVTDNGGNTGAAKAATGVVYPVVVGLSYKTDSASGVVGTDGSYTYKANENVTFSAGGVELATVPATANVTPLPLDNEGSAVNMLRLFTALDTDRNLSNGIALPSLPASDAKVDLASETSVAAALTSLAPAATLPSASTAGIATTLASAKTTALQNMGTYGSTYTTIIVHALSGVTPTAYQPKNAVVKLTSQPNWSTGAVAGTATLTLNDNSQVTFSFSTAQGTYTALGKSQTFSISSDYGAKSRVIHLIYGDPTATGSAAKGELILRDDSQPNMRPVAAIAPVVQASPTGPAGGWTGWTYTYHSVPATAGGIMDGSKDLDGIIVSQSWSSSKGKTGTGNTFSETFLNGEGGSITITVTDDQGATASKTIQVNGGTSGSVSFNQFVKLTAGNKWVFNSKDSTTTSGQTSSFTGTETFVLADAANLGIKMTDTAVNSWNGVTDTDFSYLKWDNTGQLVQTDSAGSVSMFAPSSLKVGTSWKSDGMTTTVTGINVSRTIDGVGAFNDVLALSTSEPGCTGAIYFSKAVGFFIEETTTCTDSSGSNTYTLTLKPGYIAK